jgi:hypothetical protein
MLAKANEAIANADQRDAEIATKYLTVLTEATTKLPLPTAHGMELTEEEPAKFLLVFTHDGKCTVEAEVKTTVKTRKASKTTERGGQTDLFEKGYRKGDHPCRLVRTEAVAQHGGFDDLEHIISATILDSRTMEASNRDGVPKQGAPTGTARHAAGAGNSTGLYMPSLDGMKFWFGDPSSYVMRDGVRLEIDHATYEVIAPPAEESADEPTE